MLELIADLAVNAPLKQLFSYLVPQELAERIQVGDRVRIPFGRRTTIGFVVALRRGEGAGLKALRERLDPEPLLPATLMQLLSWAAEYYCHPLGQVIRTALPAGLGSDRGGTKILHQPWYQPLSREDQPRGRKQRDLLAYLKDRGGAGLNELREGFPFPHASLKALVEQKFVRQEQREIQRDPFLAEPLPEDSRWPLTAEQQTAFEAIAAALENPGFQPFLLHGVTGSGKTEVYLRSVNKCLQGGRQALILVPEIALTPQLVARFRARFEPDATRIGVLHSGMSDGERYDTWRAILRGQVQVVIGARSAIFAPLSRIGLIIVDEEHEASYKQGEGFRYNARDLALVLGQQLGCPVLLGSATPSLGSYYRSEEGGLQRLSLSRRVHSGEMPQVELIDLRVEITESVLSAPLVEALKATLEGGEQALLLLNRRGFAPFLLCTDCGTSFHCPNCEITLTFHQRERLLRCHYCDYSEPPKESCPKCQGLNIEPEGAGTERLEEELKSLFPKAVIARMDRDTTSRKGAHQALVQRMLKRQVDILVGTQMVAKGHDFPAVGLVGVVGADSTLNLPDFRSAERGFTLLTQVAGRAGRATGGGKVLIQTYNPDHFALVCAAAQDYASFYAEELPFRQELGYPPCGHLVNLVFSGNSSDQVKSAAEGCAARLQSVAPAGLEILGPSPCPLTRLRGKTRYQVLLKASQRPALRYLLKTHEELFRETAKGVRLLIDVDPLEMF